MNILLRMDGKTITLTWEAFEEWLRDGRIPPSAEIRFDAVTGPRFVPIRELELYQAYVHSDAVVFRRSLLGGSLPLVTVILLGLQLRIYVWSLLPGADHWLFTHLAKWGPAVLEQGEVYRLLSYGALHLNLTHLLFNLLFLAYTGWNLERAMGRLNLLTLTAASVLVGGVLSMTMSLDRASLGASGGDFGLIAACVILGWKYGELVPPRARRYFGWSILPYLVFTLFSGFQASDVDNWGHLGGILGGGLMMTLLHPEILRRHATQNRRIRRGFVLVSVLALAVLALVGQHLVPLTDWDNPGLRTARPTYWAEGWTFTGDRGAFSPNRLAILVAATSTHPEPVDLAQAEQRFIEQVGTGRNHAQVLERHPGSRQGWPAVELKIAFELSGEPHVMDVLLVTRGHYLHRVHLHRAASTAARYGTLWQRVLDATDIQEPAELIEARNRCQTHPRSWRTWNDLATAQHKAGHPLEARRAYEQSMALNARQPGPVVGWLTLLRQYSLPGGDVAVRQALELLPDRPDTHVAAAELLAHLGEVEQAVALLQEAQQLHPSDRDVTLAISRLAPQTESPTTTPPAEEPSK